MTQLRQTSAIFSLVLAFFSVLPAYRAPIIGIPSVDAASNNIALEGKVQGWNGTNPSIAVTNGDTVNLSLKSLDTGHLFYIDIDGNGIYDCPREKCSEIFPPDTSLLFDVDFPAGNYEYVCPFHPGSMRGNFAVRGFNITSTPPSLRISQGSSDTATITVTSANGFTGVVDLSATSSPPGPTPTLNPPTITFLPGDSAKTSILTVNTTGAFPTIYAINVTGTSGAATAFRAVPTLVVPPDFGISANPTTLAIPLGSAGSSTITLTSLDSFSGNIDLSMDRQPTGIGFGFSQDPVFLSSGGSETSLLDVTVSPLTAQGTYMVDVIGTNGSLTHSVTITIVAGRDFGISAAPAALFLTPGSSDSSTITVTSFNDFAGRVNLTATGSPGGPTFSFSSPSILFSGSGEIPSVITIATADTTAASNFTIAIIATNGSIVHSIDLTVSVRDFSVTASGSNLIVQQGSSTTTTVSIISLNRFARVVNLTTASSSVLSRLLNVTTLSLSPSGMGFVLLTINAASVQAGTYTVSIIGTSGSLVRTASLTITVHASPGGAGILPLIGGIAVTVVGIATAGLYFTRRRRLRQKPPGSQVPT